MLKEFKAFAMRGNVLDMAVGIIIGAAFGKIVSSLVKDVVTPLLSMIGSNVDFSQRFLNLGDGSYQTLAEAQEAGAPTLNYGMFLQSIFDFIIVAFAIFMMIKAFNSAKKKEQEKPKAPPAPPKQEVLLTEIRDLLKARS